MLRNKPGRQFQKPLFMARRTEREKRERLVRLSAWLITQLRYGSKKMAFTALFQIAKGLGPTLTGLL